MLAARVGVLGAVVAALVLTAELGVAIKLQHRICPTATPTTVEVDDLVRRLDRHEFTEIAKPSPTLDDTLILEPDTDIGGR